MKLNLFLTRQILYMQAVTKEELQVDKLFKGAV